MTTQFGLDYQRRVPTPILFLIGRLKAASSYDRSKPLRYTSLILSYLSIDFPVQEDFHPPSLLGEERSLPIQDGPICSHQHQIKADLQLGDDSSDMRL